MAHIRPLLPEDFPHAGRIFFCAVHEGTRNVYSPEQRLAWGGATIDLGRWRERIRGMAGFVAEVAGEPVGFITLDGDGHVDLAFVLPSQARRGVGAALLHAVEAQARAQGTPRLTTHASLAAQPLFARHGWEVVEAQTVMRNGVALDRCAMRKPLSAPR